MKLLSRQCGRKEKSYVCKKDSRYLGAGRKLWIWLGVHLDRVHQKRRGGKTQRVEKISRDDFVRVMDEAFKDNLNDWRYNRILEVADAYADYEYEARKKLEKIQWGKDICAASGEDTDDLPEEVFLSVAEKLEDRMLENNGDLEYAVVQEVVNEFREQEEEDEID